MSDMPQEGLSDAMQAQVISPVWHVASYLQAVALATLGMENEAHAALKEGTNIEAKKNQDSGQKWNVKCFLVADESPQPYLIVVLFLWR